MVDPHKTPSDVPDDAEDAASSSATELPAKSTKRGQRQRSTRQKKPLLLAPTVKARKDRGRKRRTTVFDDDDDDDDLEEEMVAASAAGGVAAKVEQTEALFRPVAGPAQMRRRHFGIIISFVLTVLLPTFLTGLYLELVARDQYASTTGFTVQQEDDSSASAVLTGLAALTGKQSGVNGNVLYEYIRSQAIVERISTEVDLVGHYGQGWPEDPIYSIWPDASIEDLVWLWRRFVRLSFDSSTGLFRVEVRAFDPNTATTIAQLILGESQRMINDLNEAARRDALSSAEADLEQGIERLRKAREDLATFRAETRIVDPETDAQARLGVVTNLQQQLAQSLVELDLLIPTTREGDPRRVQLERRIDVIRQRIDAERDSFVSGNVDSESNYPVLLARYESLSVDLQFAQQNYTAALAALDAARSAAARRSLYLATFIPPTSAEQSEYPARILLIAMAAALMLMIWSVMVLIYYSLKDRG